MNTRKNFPNTRVEIKDHWERLRNQMVNLETSSVIFGRWKALRLCTEEKLPFKGK